MNPLNGKWQHFETLENGTSLPSPTNHIWEFRDDRLLTPAFNPKGMLMVDALEVHFEIEPCYFSVRRIGTEMEGVFTPQGRKCPAGNMTFDLNGDILRIGYSDGSNRKLKQAELYCPKGNVSVGLFKRVE